MVLPLGEQGDDLESGRVADLLEQVSSRKALSKPFCLTDFPRSVFSFSVKFA
jgi:hypothetical protein